MSTKMKRLQFYLEPELDRELEKEARNSGISKASLIREGVRKVLSDTASPADDPLFKIIGLGDSGHTNISEEHDTYLAALKLTKK